MIIIQPVFLWRHLCPPGFNCPTTTWELAWSIWHPGSRFRGDQPTQWRKQPTSRTHLGHLAHLSPLSLNFPGGQHCIKHRLNVELALGPTLIGKHWIKKTETCYQSQCHCLCKARITHSLTLEICDTVSDKVTYSALQTLRPNRIETTTKTSLKRWNSLIQSLCFLSFLCNGWC